MNKSLESLVQEIVEATNLRRSVKKELVNELCSHVLEKERELQLKGFSEEKIFEIISSEFNKDHMVEEFKQVHSQNLHWKWKLLAVGITLVVFSGIIVIFNPYVRGEFAPPLFFRMFALSGVTLFAGTTGVIFPFNLLFISFLFLLGYGWSKILSLLKVFSREKVVLMRNYIMGSSLVLHWIALIFSYVKLISDNEFEPIAKGGFPLRVFLYPLANVAEQTSTLQFMPRFVLQYTFWFVVAVGLYLLLPKKVKENKKIATIVFVCGLAATWFGGGYVVIQFMD